MSPQENKTSIAHHSTLYQQFLEERNEILKHKWLLSENAGKDIGFEAGLLDWVRRYRSSCKASRPVGLANDPQTRLPLPGVAGEEGFLPTLSIPRNK